MSHQVSNKKFMTVTYRMRRALTQFKKWVTSGNFLLRKDSWRRSGKGYLLKNMQASGDLWRHYPYNSQDLAWRLWSMVSDVHYVLQTRVCRSVEMEAKRGWTVMSRESYRIKEFTGGKTAVPDKSRECLKVSAAGEEVKSSLGVVCKESKTHPKSSNQSIPDKQAWRADLKV